MPQPTSKARLVITALFVDHQTPAEVAARYGVHRAWVYKLKARYEAEGDAALEPRSRRPKTSPAALAPEVAGGSDHKSVMDRLGHAQIQTTQKYLHTLPDADQRNLDALNRITQRRES